MLCKDFIKGTCPLGSKCPNEHVDVKEVVKRDVMSAIEGKQWMFSSYGPFKFKPCLPNLAEDWSFEEARLASYEAKESGKSDEHNKQVIKNAEETKAKMKTLLELSPEMLDAVMDVHDTPNKSANVESAIFGTAPKAPPKGSIAFTQKVQFGQAVPPAGSQSKSSANPAASTRRPTRIVILKRTIQIQPVKITSKPQNSSGNATGNSQSTSANAPKEETPQQVSPSSEVDAQNATPPESVQPPPPPPPPPSPPAPEPPATEPPASEPPAPEPPAPEPRLITDHAEILRPAEILKLEEIAASEADN